MNTAHPMRRPLPLPCGRPLSQGAVTKTGWQGGRHPEGLAMSLIEPTTWRGGTPWTISVLLLSLPSLIVVILHALYAPGTLPDFLDFVVAWAITLTSMGGAVLTLAACVVSAVATLQKNGPRKAKVVMWAFVSLSLLA